MQLYHILPLLPRMNDDGDKVLAAGKQGGKKKGKDNLACLLLLKKSDIYVTVLVFPHYRISLILSPDTLHDLHPLNMSKFLITKLTYSIKSQNGFSWKGP